MIPLLSASQVKLADAETIKQRALQQGELMETAGTLCAQYITQHFSAYKKFIFFCGKGNNGGDGLVIARLLQKQKLQVRVCIVQTSSNSSDDFTLNFNRLEKTRVNIVQVSEKNQLPEIKNDEMVIDAIFGTGLSKPVKGIALEAIKHINAFSRFTVAVDLPSGLMSDISCKSYSEGIVRANFTLTIGAPKICLFLPENATFVGDYALLDIGLDKNFIASLNPVFFLVEESDVKKCLPQRNKFSHKGNFGHAILLAGSLGKTGAAVLAAKACLHSGVGLLTVQVPKSGYEIMQVSVPESMCLVDEGENYLKTVNDYSTYSCIGMGPGIGKENETAALLHKLLQLKKPMVLDADALNILGDNKEWLNELPAGTIFTPHVKEFARMFGETQNDFERIDLLRNSAMKYKIYIVLKGHYTITATPHGICYINTTGNAGMAKGGSGDVLTGILTALLAQGLTPLDVCLPGVYLHGMAGDLGQENESAESMTAGDIVNAIGTAFKKIHAG